MHHGSIPRLAAACLAIALSLLAGGANSLLGTCGPFTDVAADVFCPFVLEIFYLGITTGTTPTTYDPTANVSRLQMAAFLSRTVDGALKRGSRRAILDQFWTSQNSTVLGLTTVGPDPYLVKSDGADVWVAGKTPATVSRVRASDGKLLETWTGATNAWGVLSATGRILATGLTTPGRLYSIDPTQPAGAVTTVASNLGTLPVELTFDGARIFTANAGGSLSIVTPGASIPWTVTTVTTGFGLGLRGALYDGNNVWVTSIGTNGAVVKLDAAGAILQTVTVGSGAYFPVFDGANIWVPTNSDYTLVVVRASSGAVLATLTGNGLNAPVTAAFDGQRILVTNQLGASVSLWKAADLTALGTFDVGVVPLGACSDGINFWISLNGTGQLARF